jgi:hypothetical protein
MIVAQFHKTTIQGFYVELYVMPDVPTAPKDCQIYKEGFNGTLESAQCGHLSRGNEDMDISYADLDAIEAWAIAHGYTSDRIDRG